MTTAVVGVGGTELARSTDIGLPHLAVEAALGAVNDAGLTLDAIDGYVGSPIAPNHSAVHRDGVDEVSAALMTRSLGLAPTFALDVIGMPAAAVSVAASAIESGSCEAVIVLRAVHNPTDRPYSFARARAVGGPEQFTLPAGVGPGGARHAMWLARYQHEFGATRDDMFHVVHAFRQHALANPLAYWRDRPLQYDEYMSARWICEPLCLYDCDIPVTGAAAIVLVSERTARSLGRPAAYLRASAGAAVPEAVFGRARIAATDVDVAQIYDGYSSFVYLWLERLGLAQPGHAFQLARDGELGRHGSIPTNTFGGSLGEGRLHGMGHVREAVLQAMGRAGDRQIPDVVNSLAVVGTPESAWALIFSPSP